MANKPSEKPSEKFDPSANASDIMELIQKGDKEGASRRYLEAELLSVGASGPADGLLKYEPVRRNHESVRSLATSAKEDRQRFWRGATSLYNGLEAQLEPYAGWL